MTGTNRKPHPERKNPSRAEEWRSRKLESNAKRLKSVWTGNGWTNR